MLYVLMLFSRLYDQISNQSQCHSMSALWESQVRAMGNTWESAIESNKWAEFCSLVNNNVHMINKPDSADWMPLQWAALYGRSRMAQYLVQGGAVVNMQVKSNGWTAVYIAAVNGHTDKDGTTPLHVSAFLGHTSIIVKHLVNKI